VIRSASSAPRSSPAGRLIRPVAAAAAGLMIATLPIPASVFLLAMMILGAALIISPLAAFPVLLTLAPMRTLIATEADYQTPLEIGQITVLILGAAWSVRRVLVQGRLLNVPWSPVIMPLIGFVAASGLSAFTAFSLAAWLNEWLKWVLILALCLLTLDSARERRWEWIVLALVTAATANALIGAYIFFGGSGADHLLVEGRFFRAFGTFGQPNPFGGFMGLIVPISVMMAVGHSLRVMTGWRNRGSLRWGDALLAGFYGLAAGLIAGGVIFSWSRGAWLSFAVSMFVLIVAFPRRWWQGAAIGAIAIAGALGIGQSGLVPASIAQRINSATQDLFSTLDVRGVDVNSENYAVIERVAHWQAAINMARQHPWLGVGFGNYEVAYEQYRLLYWDEPLGHAHNYYLNVWAETGIIGLLLYFSLWFTIFWFTWRARRSPDVIGRCLAVGLLGSWTYLAVHSLTDNLYVNNVFLHLGVMFGLLAVLHEHTGRRAVLTGLA